MKSVSIPPRTPSRCVTRRAAAKVCRKGGSARRASEWSKNGYWNFVRFSANWAERKKEGAASMFTGTGTALVTPFRRDGSLDEPALRVLIKRQIEAGVDFLVPCGTTGESPTLTHEEHLRVVKITVELANGKVPVLGGAGGYNTAEVIALSQELAALGADGILSVTPYYNKPTQEASFNNYPPTPEPFPLPTILKAGQGPPGGNTEPGRCRALAKTEN